MAKRLDPAFDSDSDDSTFQLILVRRDTLGRQVDPKVRARDMEMVGDIRATLAEARFNSEKIEAVVSALRQKWGISRAQVFRLDGRKG